MMYLSVSYTHLDVYKRQALGRARVPADGAQLIVSDGTADIRFWDPATLQETGRITVRDTEAVSYTHLL